MLFWGTTSLAKSSDSLSMALRLSSEATIITAYPKIIFHPSATWNQARRTAKFQATAKTQ